MSELLLALDFLGDGLGPCILYYSLVTALHFPGCLLFYPLQELCSGWSLSLWEGGGYHVMAMMVSSQVTGVTCPIESGCLILQPGNKEDIIDEEC